LTENVPLDLEFCRAFFPPIGNGVAYFENAGGSYVPLPVIQRLTAFMERCQNQPYGAYETSRMATALLETAECRMAEMIGAATEEIVIGPSTTLNIYVLAQALRASFEPGDEIIVTEQDHEANGGAWRRLADDGIVIKEWRIDPESGELDPADLNDLLSERSRLVCFPHCSNVVGTINPVAEITAKAHAAGAMVCVDGVAYAAHARLDVKDWDVDFYLFSLYKLYGPHLAMLYGKREAMARCQNQNHFFLEGKGSKALNPGGWNYESVAALSGIIDYFDAVYAQHFEAEANGLRGRLAAVFGLFAAQEEALAGRFVDFLLSKPQVRLIGQKTGDRSLRMPTFSFSAEGRRSGEIAAYLAEQQVAIGHGHFYGYRCVKALGFEDPADGVIRASMVHYNSDEELDRLIAALDRVL
jgi:cysteine desulfurase family protein (TIGR01976 family)